MHHIQVQIKELIRQDIVHFLLSLASIPESNDDKFALAGLLTYSTFSAFPFKINSNSGIVVKKLFSELTATGTAPDSHRIPFSSPSDKNQIHENQLHCKCIKKYKIRLINPLFLQHTVFQILI